MRNRYKALYAAGFVASMTVAGTTDLILAFRDRFVGRS